MKNLQPLILLILLSVCGQSQELVFEKEMKYSKTMDLFTVNYPSGDSIALLIKDKKTIQLFVFNSDMSSLAEMSTEYEGAYYSNFLGSFISGSNVYLNFLHRNQKLLLTLIFNITTKEIKSKQIEFKRSKERFVTAFSDTGRLLIVTTPKRQSKINVCIFDKSTRFSCREYDFSNSSFSINSYPYTLDELLKPGKKSAKVVNNIPVNIEEAGKETKIYYQGKHVLISLDSYDMKTRLLELNIEDGSKLKLDFGQVTILNKVIIHSNSFIYDDFLYQFTTGKEEWAISKIDYLSVGKRQTVKINKLNFESYIHSTISFNSENNDFYTYEEVVPKKVKSLYNKISLYDPVVFVAEENNDNLQLIIGGYKYKSQAGAMGAAPGGGGGMMMYGGGGTIFMTQCIATVLNSKTFSVLPGKIENCEIETISEYVTNLKTETVDDQDFLLYKNHLSAEKMFRYNNEYYLGYYLKEDKKYYLYRFGNSVE